MSAFLLLGSFLSSGHHFKKAPVENKTERNKATYRSVKICLAWPVVPKLNAFFMPFFKSRPVKARGTDISTCMGYIYVSKPAISDEAKYIQGEDEKDGGTIFQYKRSRRLPTNFALCAKGGW